MRIESLIEKPEWRVPAKGALRVPEVLAPAGNEEMMRAAVENGADAVYFGLQQFNARMRAANFDIADLPRIMAWLHERGARGYVTMNTLVFPSEMQGAAELLRACSDAGVDAVLVQDLGVALLAREMVPELSVHASTQMTLTSAESVHATEELGLKLDRVVTAREISRRELQSMMRATDREIEVFVHGAICIAYSGQCLTSEALGGRSANRGECAQACRLPYDMIVDGERRDLGDVRYLLSPKDLAALEDIGDLMRLGLSSLKIEGRLKSPQYVAATVQSYRAAIASVLAHPDERPAPDEHHRRDLEMTFSRGFTGGYLHDIDHQAVVEGRFPKKRGLFLGRVTSVERNGIAVALEGPLKPGDGIVFDAGDPENEEGGRVYELWDGRRRLETFDPLDGDAAGTEVLLTFGTRAIDQRRVSPGDRVWKTSDPARDAELIASYDGERIRFQRPISARIEGGPGTPLQLTLRDADGLEVSATDSAPAEAPRKHALSEETMREHLSKLGNTPFHLAHLEVALDAPIMVPFSRLNELRRQAAEKLIEARRKRGRGRAVHASALEELRAANTRKAAATETATRLSVLCRTLPQVEAAVATGLVHTVYTDFEDIRLHREARAFVPRGGPRFVPATLRIMKPGEAGIVRKLIEAEPDAVLVRNLGAWQVMRALAPQLPLLADYSLNVANDLTAALLMGHGFEQLVPSYDLNIEQLLDLLSASKPDWFEVTIHQYMPMFHMEHCVFCRFLSKGTDFTNCGRPCESHDLRLRDRVGSEHPVKADAGCRNTVFNAVAQSASAYLDAIRAAGVRKFRVDLLLEDHATTRNVIQTYHPAVTGAEVGEDLWRRLKASSKLGVTRGSLDHE